MWSDLAAHLSHQTLPYYHETSFSHGHIFTSHTDIYLLFIHTYCKLLHIRIRRLLYLPVQVSCFQCNVSRRSCTYCSISAPARSSLISQNSTWYSYSLTRTSIQEHCLQSIGLLNWNTRRRDRLITRSESPLSLGFPGWSPPAENNLLLKHWIPSMSLFHPFIAHLWVWHHRELAINACQLRSNVAVHHRRRGCLDKIFP